MYQQPVAPEAIHSLLVLRTRYDTAYVLKDGKVQNLICAESEKPDLGNGQKREREWL
jgi:hypothetical protein